MSPIAPEPIPFSNAVQVINSLELRTGGYSFSVCIVFLLLSCLFYVITFLGVDV